MRRRYKVTAATAVLLLGVCLAWPLRRAGDPTRFGGALPPQPTAALAKLEPLEALVPEHHVPQVPAISASLAFVDASPVTPMEQPLAGESPAAEPFDLPVDGTGPRPVYQSAADAALAVGLADSQVAEEMAARVHVVHNGDTLPRLAKRYLGDEGRALEIFDLNREQLSNPHLLPIGAELQIPAAANDE